MELSPVPQPISRTLQLRIGRKVFLPGITLLLQKSRMPQIRGVQGRSRSNLLRALGNEGDGASSAFPPGKKHDKFITCFRSHQKFIRKTYPNEFKYPVIILFFYTLSCFLCNCRVYCLSVILKDPRSNAICLAKNIFARL